MTGEWGEVGASSQVSMEMTKGLSDLEMTKKSRVLPKPLEHVCSVGEMTSPPMRCNQPDDRI
eukprot:7444641-Heterocapsa_arctica.AAC.1